MTVAVLLLAVEQKSSGPVLLLIVLLEDLELVLLEVAALAAARTVHHLAVGLNLVHCFPWPKGYVH